MHLNLKKVPFEENKKNCASVHYMIGLQFNVSFPDASLDLGMWRVSDPSQQINNAAQSMYKQQFLAHTAICSLLRNQLVKIWGLH